MADSNRGICFLCSTEALAHSPSVHFKGKNNNGKTICINQGQHLAFSTSSGKRPGKINFSSPRCEEKGCVFPASSPDSGKCSYHTRQQEEPVLFCSHQPTGLLLDPSRTGPAEKEYDSSRKRDRRRMAAIWEQFQGDGTL